MALLECRAEQTHRRKNKKSEKGKATHHIKLRTPEHPSSKLEHVKLKRRQEIRSIVPLETPKTAPASVANRTERDGIRGAQCAPKLRTGGAEDDSWHGRTRTGADLQGVGGELPPAAPRHGGRPLQQRRRRSRKEAGGPWDQRRACCIAVAVRREIPSPWPRRETLARPYGYGRRGAWPVSGEGRSRGLEVWNTGGEDWPSGGRERGTWSRREVKGCGDAAIGDGFGFLLLLRRIFFPLLPIFLSFFPTTSTTEDF